MKRKKRVIRTKATRSRNRKTIAVLLLLFLSIPLTIYLLQNDHGIRQNAQQAVSPTFFCAGNCPAVSSDPFEVGSGKNVPGFTNSPDNNPKQINFQPCPKNSSVEDNAYGTEDDRHKKSEKKNSKHKKSSGESSGGIQKMISQLKELIEKLLALVGGQGGDQPKQEEPTQPTQGAQSTSAPSQAEPTAPCPPASTAPEPSASAGGSGGSAPSETPSGAPEDISAAPSGGASPDENVPANTDTCTGKYSLKAPKNQNFGDPQCNFDKNKLYEQLKTADATNADIWFNEVAPCESSFNPNAIQPPAQAVDPGGAYGLFQMGQGKNGDLDHGDVVWGKQATNAIAYRNKANSWRYWACAKSHWK